jgi:hypothetical protein
MPCPAVDRLGGVDQRSRRLQKEEVIEVAVVSNPTIPDPIVGQS